MNLPFLTQINGIPNFFVQKIWQGLLSSDYAVCSEEQYREFLEAYEKRFGAAWDQELEYDRIADCRFPKEYSPKIHSLREDKSNRWTGGKNIHFLINNRTPDVFQFAPVLPCVSVQKIEIWYQPELFNYDPPRPWIFIDGVSITKEKIDQLAFNDGFDTYEDFVRFFNKDFKGKIIHWTDFKY